MNEIFGHSHGHDINLFYLLYFQFQNKILLPQFYDDSMMRLCCYVVDETFFY